jgi:hypothetical protein
MNTIFACGLLFLTSCASRLRVSPDRVGQTLEQLEHLATQKITLPMTPELQRQHKAQGLCVVLAEGGSIFARGLQSPSKFIAPPNTFRLG